MKAKFPLLIIAISFLMSFFFFSTIVSADEIREQPEISKAGLTAMFEADKEYDNNELIIKFKPETTDAEKQKVLSSIEGTEISTMLNGKYSLVSLPKGSELLTVANRLLDQKIIEFVQPNYKVEKTYVPSDSGYKKQWHLPKIQMPKAWDITKGSSAITVAVIDTGLQTNHPDLAGKIVSPYDVITGKNSVPPHAHGTHVTGIIAASINQGGVAGIAPNVKIMPINVFIYDVTYDFTIAEAIIYAADKGANIINMSFAGGFYSYLQDDAATYAKNKGVTLIAASGNIGSESRMYPAALPAVIAVGATDSQDNITIFSNWGKHIDLVAPGENIYSTVPGSSYGNLSGTSMAAPVVSGVAALILSKNPVLSPDQVEEILKGSALDVGTRGWDRYYGYGRVDALKALQKTSTPMTAISSAATFTSTGTNKTSMSFSAQKGATVSVYVEKSKGTTIKKLINPKKWNGGKITATWDGKLDSGLYASSGSYTLVAKLSSGRENIYKTKTIKLTNQVKPTIKTGPSAVYSPESSSKLSLSYEVNQTTAITAKIYDSKNTLVKTVLTNKTVTAKTNKIEWDGTDSKGKKVKDGLYKLAVSGIGANKIKASTAYTAIKIESVKPTAQIDLLASPFKTDGTSKSALKVTVKEKVSMTTYVTTDKGVKVKRLTHNQTLNTGTATLKWDGKNDQGKWVAEGKYVYQTEVKDGAGNLLIAKSKVFALEDWRKPVVSSTKDFVYQEEGAVSFSYSLNKPVKVTIQLLKKGQVIKTIESGISKNAGANKFAWDGKDQAEKLLADGKYQYAITAVDKYKNSITYTGNMAMSVDPVEITYAPIISFYGSYFAGVGYYELSKDSTVTVEIYDSENTKLKTLQETYNKAGINFFVWNYYDEAGNKNFWENGLYYYVIKAKNFRGIETKVKGKITRNENPVWLVSHALSIAPAGNAQEHTELDFEVVVKAPATLSLYLYDDFRVNSRRHEAIYKLTKGTNKMTYINKSSNHKYYQIYYTDELGNEYLYKTGELTF
ncbi:S8 family serine peptidase [Planococcus sp. N028]|uniref:S8 family serine peptidase n=1 Tax=Planococcus shixiaomingii TaxID=3058393 RepID=A0ABT8N1F7_9BACL|nr:S8 family serine peptidase [Planococcus sp. N028]MDN7241727.1 S8 family serine peptidase [Planococcus sp. N028]